ncbi:MAG TPA: carbon-nitrogen hydrolase family protein [Methylomusa anaerophila]|uniref:2-oxoglutaramate amidase n=1 Tax=Methylomusa anaerophila TaxID=1930071 RepID=A0A348AK95_9FIRM|nr:carbon-nitrogen hydrolase family protein [Methylomusa anaerophila]BBB91493.1 2-oxoglutaramate amidase [Methylomusa anaerophila]HML89918.1 carbon-nitrogen hydrolase family protein [Methylomusa anaerophila]
MGNQVKVGICQIRVETDKHTNIVKGQEMIQKAAAAGCRLIVLPEMFNCPYQSELFPVYAETYPGGPTIGMLAETAAREKVILVGGSIPERDENNRIYNTSYIFDESGKLAGRHRKVHLFDVNIKGGTVFQESLTLAAGDKLTLVDAPFATIGVAICYDVRFPEMARAMMLKGAKILVYPAAFGPVTGPLHWELLMRARAMDNQVFVIAAAPARNDMAEYKAYGHSLIVDPWARVLAAADEGETLLMVEIDLDVVDEVREELPVLKHRREGIYPDVNS